jgi:hypothetical protein
MDKCSICGSERLLPGAAYSPLEIRCLDCGSVFNRTERVVVPESEIQSQIAEMVPIPEGGLNTIEEMKAHIERLKEAKKQVSTKEVVTNNVTRPKRKQHAVSDIDPRMVMAVIDYYQREGESWNEVLATGKGEREVRNYNILIWVHNHIMGHDCTATCRELLSDG